MLIAHLPAGYLFSRAVIRRAGAADARRLMAFGLVGSVLPDFDLAWCYLVDGWQVHHHRYFPHWPSFWLLLMLALPPLLRFAQRSHYVLPMRLLCANALLHLVLDSVVGDISWLAPFVDRRYSLFTVPAIYGPSVWNFVLHWSFALELGLVGVAACVLFVRQRKLVRAALGALCALGVGLGAWAFALEPASLAEKRRTLFIPHWSSELAGLKVVVLADLHVGSPFNGIDKLERIVEAANAMRPDLVIIPGDFVIQGVVGGRFVTPEDSAAVLSRLSAPLGVWACLGNHDWWLGAQRVRSALEKNGIRVLEDAAARLEHRGTAFWIVGISDFIEGPHDVRKAFGDVTDRASVLAFTHNPDAFPAISARFSLLIAGHTHGGQVHLPLAGRPIVPSKYGERYAIGHVVENRRHLYVSPGIGTSIVPVRFRVPPEVTLLELHPEPNGARIRKRQLCPECQKVPPRGKSD